MKLTLDEQLDMGLALAKVPTDVSHYKTPKGKATAVHAHLRRVAMAQGSDPDNVWLMEPGTSWFLGYADTWQVCWEEGEFEWASNVTGWDDGSYRACHLTGVNGPHVYAECACSFALSFYKI